MIRSETDEVEAVPCDIGGVHFSKVKGFDSQQGSCFNNTSVNVGGSIFSGIDKGLSIKFEPCVGSEGNLSCQPEQAFSEFFDGAAFFASSTGNQLNFEDANQRLEDMHE